jgi:hypothetical protein
VERRVEEGSPTVTSAYRDKELMMESMTQDTISNTQDRSPWIWLVYRWPTWLALACAALTFGPNDNDTVRGLAEFILLLQLNYLVTSVLRRRWIAWAGLPVSFAVAIGLRLQDAVESSSVLVGLSAIVLLWGLSRSRLRGSRWFLIQAGGMVGFAAFALTALAVDPQLALYLTAAGWFLHGMWDFVHLWKDRVVARSFAEWCGVVDVLLAAELLLMS